MKYSITFILFAPLLANAECDKVVPGYEKQDVMYVLCSELKIKNDVQSAKLIKNVMGQYKGPPDEILVHFVKSKI